MKVLRDEEGFRISLQDRSWEWGELSLENSAYGGVEVTMVSPCSVFLCRISLSLFNLTGVPSPWLPITSFKTHSIVGVPPEDEDCTDSVKGGGKRWGHELHINMLHSCAK